MTDWAGSLWANLATPSGSTIHLMDGGRVTNIRKIHTRIKTLTCALACSDLLGISDRALAIRKSRLRCIQDRAVNCGGLGWVERMRPYCAMCTNQLLQWRKKKKKSVPCINKLLLTCIRDWSPGALPVWKKGLWCFPFYSSMLHRDGRLTSWLSLITESVSCQHLKQPY